MIGEGSGSPSEIILVIPEQDLTGLNQIKAAFDKGECRISVDHISDQEIERSEREMSEVTKKLEKENDREERKKLKAEKRKLEAKSIEVKVAKLEIIKSKTARESVLKKEALFWYDHAQKKIDEHLDTVMNPNALNPTKAKQNLQKASFTAFFKALRDGVSNHGAPARIGLSIEHDIKVYHPETRKYLHPSRGNTGKDGTPREVMKWLVDYLTVPGYGGIFSGGGSMGTSRIGVTYWAGDKTIDVGREIQMRGSDNSIRIRDPITMEQWRENPSKPTERV